jgi:hypothetical protein
VHFDQTTASAAALFSDVMHAPSVRLAFFVDADVNIDIVAGFNGSDFPAFSPTLIEGLRHFFVQIESKSGFCFFLISNTRLEKKMHNRIRANHEVQFGL